MASFLIRSSYLLIMKRRSCSEDVMLVMYVKGVFSPREESRHHRVNVR